VGLSNVLIGPANHFQSGGSAKLFQFIQGILHLKQVPVLADTHQQSPFVRRGSFMVGCPWVFLPGTNYQVFERFKLDITETRLG